MEVAVTAEGCERDFESEVEVLFDPSVAFDGGPLSGCPPLPISFANYSQTETVASYTWYFGDGGTSNAVEPSHVYTVPGEYTVTLEMSTAGFCVQDLATTQTAFIEVLPTPTAGFSITPSLVDILEPVVQVEDLSSGATQHYYNFGDGGSSNEPNGTYIFQGAGVFNVTQTVINEYGCTSTAQGEVGVNGTLFYAPNSFTPDNDGVNDVWHPHCPRVLAAYECARFTTAGVMWFLRPSDPSARLARRTSMEEAHFAPDGVYLYQVYSRGPVAHSIYLFTGQNSAASGKPNSIGSAYLLLQQIGVMERRSQPIKTGDRNDRREEDVHTIAVKAGKRTYFFRHPRHPGQGPVPHHHREQASKPSPLAK